MAQSRSSQPESVFQQASHTYYKHMRKAHSGVYNSEARMQEEISKRRYKDVEPPEAAEQIQNLGSFITILHSICGSGESISGVDFGCGSHWFVDFVRTNEQYHWDAVGYDVDALAIDLAKERFPENADCYRCANPIQSTLPEAAASHDFVFCNAVLQHFDDDELKRALSEIARLLRPGGVCMLIFKCWSADIASDESGMAKAPQILDGDRHMVRYFDPTMFEEVEKLPTDEAGNLEPHTREGWRLFHIVPVKTIREFGRSCGLCDSSPLTLPDGTGIPRLYTYRSGKKMPTACLILTRED